MTQASARSKRDSSSSIGIAFDKAILKKGEEIPVNVTVQAIGVSQSAATAPATPDMQPMGGGAAASGTGMGRTGTGVPNGNPDATNPAPGGTPASIPNPERNNVSGGPGAVGGLDSNGPIGSEQSRSFWPGWDQLECGNRSTTAVCHHQFRRQGSSFGQRHATSFGDQTRSDAGGCRALRGWFAQALQSQSSDRKCSWEALQ